MGGLDLDLGLRRRTAYSRVGFRSPFVWQSIRSYDDISIGVIHIALPHGPKTVTSKTLVRAGTDLSISRSLSLRSSLVPLGTLAAEVCQVALVANEQMQLEHGFLETFQQGKEFHISLIEPAMPNIEARSLFASTEATSSNVQIDVVM